MKSCFFNASYIRSCVIFVRTIRHFNESFHNKAPMGMGMGQPQMGMGMMGNKVDPLLKH
jgi:hypothetical protein